MNVQKSIMSVSKGRISTIYNLSSEMYLKYISDNNKRVVVDDLKKYIWCLLIEEGYSILIWIAFIS